MGASSDTAPSSQFDRIVRRIDPRFRLLRARALKGGVSAQVTALEIACPGGRTRKVVVRRYGEVDLTQHQYAAKNEFRLLRLLHDRGMLVPDAYLLDESQEILPTPYIVLEYIDGSTEFTPPDLANFVGQFTMHLVSIHQVDCSNADLSFLPEQHGLCSKGLEERPKILDSSMGEGHIRDCLERVWPLTQRNPSVLLHGDYWLGNILWKDGRVTAVIDWEDAAVGDPLYDVANSRLEILWAFGVEAMEDFTQKYLSASSLDSSHLPYWDLFAALQPAGKLAGWGLSEDVERTMRERHKWFTAQAMNEAR